MAAKKQTVEAKKQTVEAQVTKIDWKKHANEIIEAVDSTLEVMTEKVNMKGIPFLYGQSLKHGFRVQIFVFPVNKSSNPHKISLK